MVLWVWLLGVGAMFPAQATERVDSVEIYAAKEQEAAAGDDGLYLDAEVDFDLSPELREAAAKGVPLYFTADLEIFEQRWWWFDKNILQAERTWKLVYSPLTRQDRKSTRLNSSHVAISYAVFCLKKKIPLIKINKQERNHQDQML